MRQDHAEKTRIIINVSGERFETFEKTLARFPDTLLGSVLKRKQFYSSDTKVYFFHRQKIAFEAILFFFQSWGTLRCPPDLDLDLFLEDCKYFELPEDIIEAMKVKEGVLPDLQRDCYESNRNRTCSTLWDILENPETSYSGRIFTSFSLCVIAASVISFILSTVESIKLTYQKSYSKSWEIADLIMESWCLCEIIFRFLCSPAKKRLIKSWFTCVDIVAILPFFIKLTFLKEGIGTFRIIRILRLTRLLRLLKIFKASKRFQVVSSTLTSSIVEFRLVVLCLSMMVVSGGYIMYNLEGSTTAEFKSLPYFLWWAIITMTTVGYGDIVPTTLAGKLFSTVFMSFGAITLTLCVLTIVDKFELLYNRNIGVRKIAQR